MKPVWHFLILISMVAAAGVLAESQKPSAPSASPSAILDFLNQTVSWYRQVPVQQQAAADSSDIVFVYDNRQIADQVIQLAFTFARAEDNANPQAPAASGHNSHTAPGQYETLSKLDATLAQQIQADQVQESAANKRLAAATGAERQKLQSQISVFDGQIAMASARRDTISSMLDFVNQTAAGDTGATGLRAQIDALANSIPLASPISSASDAPSPTASPAVSPAGIAANAAAPLPNPSSPSALAAAVARPDISRLWDLVANLIALQRKVYTAESATRATNDLVAATTRLRAPLIDQLRTLSQQGDQSAGAATAPGLAQGDQLDSLADQFKELSAAFIPLNKQIILLGLYQRNLSAWRDAVRGEQETELIDLAVRIFFLALFVAVVFGGAELWRRAIVRYVHDQRRVRQFLLLRKFVLWSVLAAIVALSFASSLGSLVTFAGLLTAGIAVALQSVILAIVAYFFLIGKYGLRIGDRVRVGDVSGEVVDMGLVHFHLLELGGAGDTPTGRTVTFSNSIVFQPASGLFKQIPGTNFAWHEITLSLPADAEYNAIRGKLLQAVGAVLEDGRDEIERQFRRLRDFGSVSDRLPQPSSQLHFTSAGLDVVIRFPVTLQNAAEIDARVSYAVHKVLQRESPSVSAGGNVKVKTALPGSEAAD